jgi:hypothetical protein
MKACSVLALSIVACGLLLSLAISARESSAQSAPLVTRHLHARTTSYVEVDNGKRGHSSGDLFTFTHVLTADGTHAGRTEGYCVRISTLTSQCTMTTFLRDGRIMVEGPLPETADSSLAVIGGTGAFARARGSVAVHRTGFFQFDLTYDVSFG